MGGGEGGPFPQTIAQQMPAHNLRQLFLPCFWCLGGLQRLGDALVFLEVLRTRGWFFLGGEDAWGGLSLREHFLLLWLLLLVLRISLMVICRVLLIYWWFVHFCSLLGILNCLWTLLWSSLIEFWRLQTHCKFHVVVEGLGIKSLGEIVWLFDWFIWENFLFFLQIFRHYFFQRLFLLIINLILICRNDHHSSYFHGWFGWAFEPFFFFLGNLLLTLLLPQQLFTIEHTHLFRIL